MDDHLIQILQGAEDAREAEKLANQKSTAQKPKVKEEGEVEEER